MRFAPHLSSPNNSKLLDASVNSKFNMLDLSLLLLGACAKEDDEKLTTIQACLGLHGWCAE
ncbi:hypothetical protein H5410_062759 [Solanum commersonii]|uniref:Uncharacterized protein n=1 Tax=Solanum commersonii TaxID=4109 RepID=A0A9J5WBI8_SOLCO|nr:hypothetical protein H5410_062759 [Solanum commersonii]